ncbi:MAG: Ferrochelatase [Chlamydiia bacterium]|nr:Ferrochelatase [Chlamydiia bacterium]MCH9616026.1 Ferrochelatase [Chlamydiia bacterium]MCH9629049.1 Ferrochelatase [Chlamydiia bacterium]
MDGVLLVNLGTPKSSRPKDVKRYLNQFLTDKRVIEMRAPMRQLLVRGLIVPRRYKESAKMYQDIWTEEGSPLLVYGKRVQSLLSEKMGTNCKVVLAMRYGEPSIEEGLSLLKDVDNLTIVPLFPQYASATTGSIQEEVMRVLSKWSIIPKLNFIQSFPTQPSMIKAFAERARQYDISAYDEVLFSFHGLPEEADYKGRYSFECLKTAQAIAKELRLEKFAFGYQSRLGRKPWLKPYTIDVLDAKKGKKILVLCPAFVCDCLETIYEIGVEYAEGRDLTLVEGLNDHPLFIQALQESIESST